MILTEPDTTKVTWYTAHTDIYIYFPCGTVVKNMSSSPGQEDPLE